jgi:ferredoxin
MPVINYIEFDGSKYSVEVAEGANLMQGALDNMIEGIIAECGGCCVCCTCHCMIHNGKMLRAALLAAKMNYLRCSANAKTIVD